MASLVYGNPSTVSENSTSLDTLEKVSIMFKVDHGQLNSFDIKNVPAFKKISGKFKFFSVTELPSGLQLSIEGVLSWSPTTEQFNRLKEQALLADFYAHTPSDNYIIGQIRVIGEPG